MAKIKLQATPDDMDTLHEIVEGARKGSELVKVPKDALNRLLKDHAKVLARLSHTDIE